MSYEEFEKEFNNAQKNKNAPYRMFVFDIKNSRKMSEYIRYDAQVKSLKTMILLAKKVLEIEENLGKRILFQDERVKLNVNFALSNPNLSNPCVNCGDAFAISIFNGICSDNEILNLFLESAKSVGNLYAYNVSIGNFETTDYSIAAKKCYIGYCLSELCFNKKHRKITINESKTNVELEK